MIRSESDPVGYTPVAEKFREYLAARINRNGATVPVTETGDFAAIIRRRIFEQTKYDKAASDVSSAYQRAVNADPPWGSQVLERLGSGKGVATLKDRISETYPFHPDLMDLVRNEWGKTQGFQRVRSTVAVFALAALHWIRASQAGKWVPALIGVGDLPIGGINGSGDVPQARGLEALLNFGPSTRKRSRDTRIPSSCDNRRNLSGWRKWSGGRGRPKTRGNRCRCRSTRPGRADGDCTLQLQPRRAKPRSSRCYET